MTFFPCWELSLVSFFAAEIWDSLALACTELWARLLPRPHVYGGGVTATPLQVVDHRPGNQDRERGTRTIDMTIIVISSITGGSL